MEELKSVAATPRDWGGWSIGKHVTSISDGASLARIAFSSRCPFFILAEAEDVKSQMPSVVALVAIFSSYKIASKPKTSLHRILSVNNFFFRPSHLPFYHFVSLYITTSIPPYPEPSTQLTVTVNAILKMAASYGVRSPHQQTLFHLIPINEKARAALDHPDNSQFVSTTSKGDGLEVGYHVPSISRGDVITSLGRDADLILNQSQYSRHVDFQLNKDVRKVMLRVLSKDKSSVSVDPCAGVGDRHMGGVTTPQLARPSKSTPRLATRRDDWDDSDDWVDRRDYGLVYGQSYLIDICGYRFWLIWVEKNPEQLQALALQRQIRELLDTQGPKHVSPFTAVHKALDNTTGNIIIVTKIKLGKFGARQDEVRSAIRQEVAFLQEHRHPNIISCLGSRYFETGLPVFYTDPKEGDILHLSETQTILWPNGLGQRMVRQMLDALAYLAENNMSHGSIEPAKILYTYNRTQNMAEIDKYGFQLSHFGISKYAVKPPAQFRAPELWDDNEPDPAKLVTPKTDVWCLLAAFAATHPSTQREISQVIGLSALCQVMRRVRNLWPLFNPMGTEDPKQRASATQMIHFLAGLEGQTQPPVAPAAALFPVAPSPAQPPVSPIPALFPVAPAPTPALFTAATSPAQPPVSPAPSLFPAAPSPALFPIVPSPARPSSVPGPVPPSPGARGPTDDPAGRGGQKLTTTVDELQYNLRTRTVTQRAEQRRNAGDRTEKRRNARHRPY
ncbi:unnamed protein product [Clonostachys byssicola]|uniref:non-specific serine/threonine protein kinase n=1 Tax=Clonostachys byssicola TaxID=160290 RepID=A0A9N9UT29_9HYPO|nr:unnamed protein product [Clonostachys byssicola]